MHHIYQAKAYILKTIPIGEADVFVTLFTKEFGLIRATAQGLRYEKSKLRFAIQNYSKATVSLVRGKNDIWRITNAQAEKSLYSSLCHPEFISGSKEIPAKAGTTVVGAGEEKFKVIARIFKLLERLLSGEEVDEELFNIVDSGIDYLEQNVFERDKLLDIESVFVLRILNRLGYVGDHKKLNFYVSDNKWESQIVEKMNSERKEALLHINIALRDSQL